MQAANIRNISLSLCLGLFSFHIYVVNSYNTSANLSSKFEMASRSLASTSESCPINNSVTIETFKSAEHSPETCEKILVLKANEDTHSVEIRLYVKVGDEIRVHPPEGSAPLTIENYGIEDPEEIRNTDFENFDTSVASLGQIPTVQAAARQLLTENMPRLESELSAAAATAGADAADSAHIDANSTAGAPAADPSAETTTPPPAGGTGAIDGDATAAATTTTAPDVTEIIATAEPTNAAPEPAAPGSIVAPTRQGDAPDEDGATPSDIDTDEIKDVFAQVDDFIEANNRCTLAASDSEYLEKIVNDLKSALGIDRDIDTFSDDVRNRELRNLSQSKAQEILDLGDDLGDIGDEGNSSDIQSKISCLSASALRESSPQAQYISYMENIRPLINGAIDSASSPQEKIAILSSFSTNSAFSNLMGSNEVVNALVQNEAQIATAVINCSAQADKTACTGELQAGLAQMKTNQAQDPNNAILNDSIGIYEEWMAKLTGTSLTGGLTGTVGDILDDANLAPGAAPGSPEAGTGEENAQDRVLKLATEAASRLAQDAARAAQANSNRRSQEIRAHQGSVPMLNDVVTPEQMSLQ